MAGKPKEERPSQDELRSIFNDYLTGKRKASPPPVPARPQPKKAQPERSARPPRPARPAPPPKPIEVVPPNLDPAQLNKLKIMKGALPPPTYRRILALPELSQDAKAFFGRWDRLLNGFGMKGAAAMLLNETKPEEACVQRLAQLLRCRPEDAKRLIEDPKFAVLPVERKAIIIRDRVAQAAKRWDAPIDLAIRVVTGRMSEGELASSLLSRKLRIDGGAAKILLAKEPAGEPVARAVSLAQRLLQQAAERKAPLSEVVIGTIENIKAEELLSGTVAQELAIPEGLAAKLCDRPPVKTLGPVERARRSIEETRTAAAELGCSPEPAARFLCALLPDDELDPIVGQAVAKALGVDPALGAELAQQPETRAVPARERAKKVLRRAEVLADKLGCSSQEAAGLLSGKLAAVSLASIFRRRLNLGEAAAQSLAEWAAAQPEPLPERILGAIDSVQEATSAASCTVDQAALIVAGRLTLADLRAAALAEELGISADLAGRLVSWMEAEKVNEAEAKARIRNLRSWAAPTPDQACRMLIKEIPTPTKSDSDALPFSGAWE